MVMKTRRSSRGAEASQNIKEKDSSSSNKMKNKRTTTITTTNKKIGKKQAKIRVAAASDPNKPKKPATAFFYYLEDFRKTYQAEHPDVKSMRDIGKACGDKWKTMTFEEKVQYYDIATERRAEYEKALTAYTKRKETGELTEESDDEQQQ